MALNSLNIREFKIMRNNINPFDYFKNKPNEFFNIITDAVELFLLDDDDTIICSNFFRYHNSEAECKVIPVIRLMLKCKFWVDLLLTNKLFDKNPSFLDFLLKRFESKNKEMELEFNSPINKSNYKNLFKCLGHFYQRKSIGTEKNEPLVKLKKLCKRYNIFFQKSENESNSIITPSMQFMICDYSILTFCRVIDLILNSPDNEEYSVRVNLDKNIIITKPDINFNTELQLKIIDYTQRIMKDYLNEHKIISDKTFRKKSIQIIDNGFKHYNIYKNEIIHDFKNSFINYLHNLYVPDSSNFFIFEGIDNITNIIKQFSSKKNLSKVQTISNSPNQYTLEIPIHNSIDNKFPYAEINTILNQSFLKSELIKNDKILSIHSTSEYRAILYILELKLTGQVDSLVALISEYGEIKPYNYKDYSFFENSNLSKYTQLKQHNHNMKINPYTYFTLSSSIDISKIILIIYKIQNILDKKFFDVFLYENGLIKSLDDILAEISKSIPKYPFFKKDKTNDMLKLIKRKIKNNQEIDCNDIKYLNNKKKFDKENTPQILIRTSNKAHIQLLNIFYELFAIKVTGLPKSINVIVFEYLGNATELTPSTQSI